MTDGIRTRDNQNHKMETLLGKSNTCSGCAHIRMPYNAHNLAPVSPVLEVELILNLEDFLV